MPKSKAPLNADVIPEPLPPPPPPSSNKKTWIGVGIGLVVVCLCCLAAGAGYYFYQNGKLPFLKPMASPTPTPVVLRYTNPSAGIDLLYPDTWVTQEDGNSEEGFQIYFYPPDPNTVLGIFTRVDMGLELPAEIDPSSPEQVLYFLKTNAFTEVLQDIEAEHATSVSGYPAASGSYRSFAEDGTPIVYYLTLVIRGDEYIVFLCICPESDFSQYRPQFDTILSSVQLE